MAAAIWDTHVFIVLLVTVGFLLAAYYWFVSPQSASRLRMPDAPCAIACGTGGYEVLRSVECASTRGAPAAFNDVRDDELVTVLVTAAGVNYADVCIRWGLYASWKKFGGGRRSSAEGDAADVPGFEFSGIVEEVGGAVVDFKVGDAVFGVTLFGGYSTRIVVPGHALFALPRRLTLSQAAAFPCTALTAWYAVCQQAEPIAAASWVLIHSAAGGVGSMLVQICKLKGWSVVGVVGKPHKIQACRDFGADIVIDKHGKSTANMWAEIDAYCPDGFAAVFDANGVSTLAGSFARLAPCGKLIVYGFHSMLPRSGGVLTAAHWLGMAWDWLRTPRFNPLDMTAANKSVLAFNLSFLFARRDILEDAMGTLLGWLDEGALRVPHVREFQLAEVRMAHAALESGLTVGKLVLLPTPCPAVTR